MPSWNWPLALALVVFLGVLSASREVRRLVVASWVGVRYLAKGVRRRLRGERGVAPELVRRAFEDLGPTYIKLGQIVASSVGLFPRRYVAEFQKCLDRVRPFDYAHVARIVEEELGAPVEDVFASFDREPLASASIAQVHAARLASGEDVVVKIQRPHIGERVDADVGILHAGAELLALLPRGELANPVAIVEDFDTTIHEELDFVREAENMAEFNRLMEVLGHEDIAAPRVHPQLTTPRVLTMERFRGVRVDDVAGVRALVADAEERLVHGVRAWFQCMVHYGFFHGDVHAGNLMVLEDGRLGFLDFGIIGRFDDHQRWMVTDYIFAFSLGDYRRLGEVMLTMDSVHREVNLDELAKDLQVAFSPIITRSLGQLNYGEIFPEIMKVALKHRMRLPNEFVLVTKQMLFFDRYAKLLAPDLNIFSDPRLVAALAGDVVRARGGATTPPPPSTPRRR